MQAPRTEELLARVRAVCEGEEHAEDVEPLLDAAHFSMERTRREFLLESRDDPEMPEATREKIDQALRDYLETLLDMRDSAAEGDLDALAAALEEAERSVESVRAAQNEHKASLATGSTLFPFLNRLLIQNEAVRGGADSARLTAMLDEAPGFFKYLRTELERRGTSPLKSQVVFELQEALESLQRALETESELPAIEMNVSEMATRLAGLLAVPVLDDGQDGATALPAVNGVLQTLQGLSGSSDEVDYLLALVDQCRDYLRSLLPVTSPPDHVEKLNEVLDTLEAVQDWALEDGDSDEKPALAADLVSSTTDLTRTLAAAQADGYARYSDLVGDLPPIFKTVLVHGHVYLDGQGSADNVYAASEHLRSSADQMLLQADELSPDDPRLAPLREAVDLMREAADMLRDLAESANPQYLEIASGLCRQAAERLGLAAL